MPLSAFHLPGPVFPYGWAYHRGRPSPFPLLELTLPRLVFPPAGSASAGPSSAEEYYQDLVAHEGEYSFLYIDTRGFVTVGIGNLVGSAQAAAALPFVRRSDGKPATATEKIAAFNHVKGKPAGRRARYYRIFTDLDLPEASIKTLALGRLRNEFIPGLEAMFPKFDDFPLPARRALVDMAYNLGVGGLRKFTKLVKSVNARDWAAAAKECHRSTCRASRNDWTRKQFEQAVQPGSGASP